MSNYVKVGAGVSTGWQRPSDWLAIPAVGASEEVFYGLHAVWDTTINPCALLCNGTGAGYTVDWGDGTITDYAFNVKAERNYAYSSLSNATLSTRGYKQTLIKVTPRAGATITTIDLQQRHSSYNYNYISGFLEIKSNFNNTTHIFGNNAEVQPNLMEYMSFKNFKVSGKGFGIIVMPRLYGISSLNFSMTSMGQYTFNDCRNLHQLNINFSSLTTFDIFFINSRIPDNFGELNFSNVTNYSNQSFSGCTNPPNKYPTLSSNITQINGFLWSMAALPPIIPALSLSNLTFFNSSAFLSNSPRSIKRSLITGLKFTHSYINQLLDSNALNEIFTNLGTANAGATITITGNHGAATCNQSLATSKGWTIIN